jgi:hypothetical protein
MTLESTLERLNHWIDVLPSKFESLSESELAERPQPNKWSKKEILGHLCDSALNNLQRFVRAQYEESPYRVLKYAQDQWVKLMGYQALPTAHILSLWVNLNRHAAEVLRNIPEDKLQTPCDIGEAQTVTLGWIAEDYVDHLEHHLKQIFGSLR